jgi:hypothetical protein
MQADVLSDFSARARAMLTICMPSTAIEWLRDEIWTSVRRGTCHEDASDWTNVRALNGDAMTEVAIVCDRKAANSQINRKPATSTSICRHPSAGL